jgi:hypothetical protein
MLKLILAVLTLALAGTAVAGWRDLRVDASSQEAFAKSLETFKDKLSPARAYVLGEALKDIWIQGERAAAAEQRDYTAEDYYDQLDGLSYEEIVTFTDPTGDIAKERYRSAALSARRAHPPAPQGPGYPTFTNATTTTDPNGHPTSN